MTNVAYDQVTEFPGANDKTVTAAQAHAWLEAGEAILVDVREADEFKNVHIPHALSLPLSGGVDSFKLPSVPLGKKIIVQCLKGSRGEQACVLLTQKVDAANRVYNLTGGIEAWREAGYPVVGKIDGGAAGISIFRQVQIIMGGLIAALIILGLAGVPFVTYVAAAFSLALMTAGITGWCGLAILLGKMPWNR